MATALTVDAATAARWFRGLGDETRLRIVGRLLEGEQCVCDLSDALDAGQSRLSFHLKTLKDAGLVSDRRQGRWVFYSLNPAAVEALSHLVGALEAPRRTLRGAPRWCC